MNDELELGALAAYPEDQCAVPALMLASSDHLELQSEGTLALFQPPWAPGTKTPTHRRTNHFFKVRLQGTEDPTEKQAHS